MSDPHFTAHPGPAAPEPGPTQSVSQERDPPIGRLNMRGRPFEKGQGGRPKGARNHATLIAESMIGKCAEPLALRALTLALEGDASMLRFCLERLVPRRDRTVTFDLPPIRSALDVALGSAQVASLVADGQLTPQEGRDVSVLFETQRRAIETALLEKSRVGLDPDPPEA